MSKMLNILTCSKCGRSIDETLKFRSFEYNGTRICEQCKKELESNDNRLRKENSKS